jgi:hypothetical protein
MSQRIVMIDHNDNYEIDEYGNCFNRKTGLQLKPQLKSTGYYAYNILDTNSKKYKHMKLHRLIAYYFIDKANSKNTSFVVDHIDRNKLNNHVSNLRYVSHSENNVNCNKKKNCTSNHKGIYWNKQHQKWRAQIQINGRQKHLGRFANEEFARYAYETAHIQYYKDFSEYWPEPKKIQVKVVKKQ